MHLGKVSETTGRRLLPVTESESQPQIIECEIRLHSSRPADQGSAEPTFADWSATVVGDAVTFQAIANPARGTWNGPLSPGVEVAPPAALDDPYWTVFLPASKGVPIMVGHVGHPLAVGEAFTLAPGQPGVWTADVVFDGAIVID
jgi:hypothetical protein